MNKEFFFYPFKGKSWKGINREKYKDLQKGWKGVSRFVFTVSDKDIPYEVRYFELEGKGYTTLEKHHHQHVVIGGKGTGKVILGKKVVKLKAFDVLLIPSWLPHQFINPTTSPFGFFCIVDKERDRPQRLRKDEIDKLMRNEEIKDIIKTD